MSTAIKFLILFLFCGSVFASPVCYFVPPEGWQIVQPKNLSQYVQVGFLGKGSSQFRPSINLAFEEDVDVTLKDYLKAVKEIHLAQAGTKWRDLGKLMTRAGEGRLTEITSTSPFGEIKLLQAIVVKDQMAYILTAAALKDDMSKIQPELLKSFKSLSLADDLFAPVSNAEKRHEIQEAFGNLGKYITDENLELQQNRQWENLQKILSEKASELGDHWLFLALREGRSKIYSTSSGQNSPSP